MKNIITIILSAFFLTGCEYQTEKDATEEFINSGNMLFKWTDCNDTFLYTKDYADGELRIFNGEWNAHAGYEVVDNNLTEYTYDINNSIIETSYSILTYNDDFFLFSSKSDYFCVYPIERYMTVEIKFTER